MGKKDDSLAPISNVPLTKELLTALKRLPHANEVCHEGAARSRRRAASRGDAHARATYGCPRAHLGGSSGWFSCGEIGNAFAGERMASFDAGTKDLLEELPFFRSKPIPKNLAE